MANRYFNTAAYKAKHAGWLLAADAPANIAKGERILADLDDAGKAAAIAYRDECLAIYAGSKEG